MDGLSPPVPVHRIILTWLQSVSSGSTALAHCANLVADFSGVNLEHKDLGVDHPTNLLGNIAALSTAEIIDSNTPSIYAKEPAAAHADSSSLGEASRSHEQVRIVRTSKGKTRGGHGNLEIPRVIELD